jgi:dTDP-4-dehydrorhamnose reductase
MTIKVMVCGSAGGLGKQISLTLAKKRINVFSISRQLYDVELEFNKFQKFILEKRPNYIINCIAKTGIDYCQKSSSKAFDINSLFTFRLANFANKLKIKMIHISTDAVFHGGYPGKLYSETDIPSPTTRYGETKLFGEILIKKFTNILIIRLPIIYGKSQKNQLINNLLEKLFKNKKIKVSSNIFSPPLYNKRCLKLYIELDK